MSRSKSQTLTDGEERQLQKSLSRHISEVAPMKLIEDEVAEEGGVGGLSHIRDLYCGHTLFIWLKYFCGS